MKTQRFASTARITVCVLIISAFAVPHSMAGQAGQLSDSAARDIAALEAWKESWTPEQQKIDSQLLQAQLEHRGLRAGGVSTLRSGIKLNSDSKTLVDIKTKVDNAVLARIDKLGGSIISSFPQYDAIRASLPIDSLEQLTAMSQVQFIRPAETAIYGPITGRVVPNGSTDLTNARPPAHSLDTK